MGQNIYRLTDKPPAQQFDIIQLKDMFFVITQIEPFYYDFDNQGNPLNTAIYSLPDLVPSADTIHYVTGIGVQNFGLQFQLRYQSGAPRGTVGARSSQRLDYIQAPYDMPFQMKLAVISGDTAELDIRTPIPNFAGHVWFYGFKMKIQKLKGDKIPEKAIVLDDLRQVYT